MRIHHVVASVLEKYGGPSYSVPALCRALADSGHDVTLHVHEPVGISGSGRFQVHGYHWSPWLRNLGLSRNMLQGLRRAAVQGDIMHVHGQWMLCNVWPSWVVQGTACKLVTSPRGMLTGWALEQSALQKRIMWTALQRRAVAASSLIHATADSEADDVRRLGLRAPIAIIPNAVEIPPSEALAGFADPERLLLYIGRLHPKKGLDRLIGAWSKLEAQLPDWRIVIAGPDEGGHRVQLEALVAELGLQRVLFEGPVYGAQKQALLRNSQLFVLPTHSENFGITVAEALAHGVPAVVSRGAPWPRLDQEDCGRWVENDVGPLSRALLEMMSKSPTALREMGLRGRGWINREFSWAKCAEMMAASYAWVRGEHERPNWVLPDSDTTR